MYMYFEKGTTSYLYKGESRWSQSAVPLPHHMRTFWPVNYTSYNGFVVVVSMLAQLNTTVTHEKCGMKAQVHELERRHALACMRAIGTLN